MNRIREVLGGASLLALMVAAAPAAAQEGPAVGPFTRYIALGDSYSSGVGAAVMNNDPCRTSSAAWPLQLAAKIGNPPVVHGACSGATTVDVMEGMGPKDKQQGGVPQINLLPPADQLDGALITIQIGGNDIGYSEKIVECILGEKKADDSRGDPPQGCPSFDELLNRSAEVISDLALRLDYTYRGLRAAAPNATIVAIGYPHLFNAKGSCDGTLTAGFLPDERQKLNELVDAGNAQMKASAAMAGIGAITDEIATAFEGYEACSKEEWIVTPETSGFSWFAISATKQYLEKVGHPNDVGHKKIADVVLSLLPGVTTRNGTVIGEQPEVEPAGVPEVEPAGVPEVEPVGVPGDERDDEGGPGNADVQGIEGGEDNAE